MTYEASVEQSEESSPALLSSSAKTRPSSPGPSQLPSIKAEVSPESICRVCLNLGNEIWDLDYRKKHNLPKPPKHIVPAKDVVIAAEQGCSGCEIIAWVLEPYMARLEEESSKVLIKFGFDYSLIFGGFFRDLCYHGGVKPTEKCVTELVIKSTPPELHHVVPPLSDKSISKITSETGSPSAINKVQTWYSECRSSHKQCLQNPNTPLPTRVIHIEGPRKARLYVSRTEHGEYACLSHCWGGQSIIRTTSRTIEEYTNNIPWEELPKTFMDAIQFAYGLGFNYLWIDSLCIVQDSLEDWRQEGSQMWKIYANASITLSATWTTSPRQGCFVTPDNRYLSRTKTFIDTDHNTYELHCHELLPELKAPLHERGWVFQERMLSRRIVHFMDQELWWECRKCFTCECRNEHHNKGIFGVDMTKTTKLVEPSSLNKIQNSWVEIVKTYTTLSLTYPTDIFPALQGLAKLVAPTMGRYLAGHWESDLIQSLCWYVEEPARCQSKEWRAPSWSWASAQKAVRWSHSRDDKCETTAYVNVLSATTITTPGGDDPTGQLSYGEIVLRGKCLAAQIEALPNPLGLDVRYVLVLHGAQGSLSSNSYPCRPRWDSMDQCINGTPVVALRIFGMRKSFGGGETYVWLYWLILRAVEGTTGKYLRIGTMEEGGTERSSSSELHLFYQKEAMEVALKVI
ncbi:hypothetical protein G6011_11603 [Alternaria panax]|uniref:Heterokaryon incompatibility domain-containing protein n=1 Tax=Alternaria panax TaxID=48097 RepID=A0AAD4IE64_9PLEO|nr:hypothetical protein G6011_11603 [Alternaria panax]